MKMGGGEGGGGGGGGAAGIGMRPGAPRLVHSGPETPPLLGLPPPLPPTWLQRSAQAGPAGAGKGPDGRSERSIVRPNKSSGQTVQAADLSAILVQESLHPPTPPPSAGNASRARFQNRKCWWTSLVAPRIFVGSPQDLVSLMNSPGGIMYHHFYSGPP